MPHIALIRPSEATGRLKKLYEAASARAGSVAEIIQVMSQDAGSASASMSFYVALMKQETGLSKRRKEMLATVVSHCNDCYY